MSRRGAEPALEVGRVPVALWATASVAAAPARFISFAIGNDQRGVGGARGVIALRAGQPGTQDDCRRRMAELEVRT